MDDCRATSGPWAGMVVERNPDTETRPPQPPAVPVQYIQSHFTYHIHCFVSGGWAKCLGWSRKREVAEARLRFLLAAWKGEVQGKEADKARAMMRSKLDRIPGFDNPEDGQQKYCLDTFRVVLSNGGMHV